MDAPAARSGRLLVWLFSIGGVLTLGGAIVSLVAPRTVSFGWVASQPLAGTIFAPATLHPLAVTGLTALGLGLAILVFAGGVAVGRRLR